MPRVPKKKLPDEVIKHWPEIFKDIEPNVVPIKYLHSVRVEFKNGKIWDIDVAKSKANEDLKDIEQSLKELFAQQEENIENIDFRLDTEAIKNDIQKRTSLFMKKRK